MHRLLVVPIVLMATLAASPVAHAQSGGAFHAECTNLPGAFPGATGGEIIITPHGNINANCRYPGPAEGGGAEQLAGTGCVITPAGNFLCNPSAPPK